MTKQEYYDLLVKTAIAGGFPAVTSYGKCLYRTSNNRKCAVGLLIPDEKYSNAIESRMLPPMCDEGIVEVPIGMTTDDLLYTQAVHDKLARNATGWSNMLFVSGLNNLPWCEGLTLADPEKLEEMRVEG